MSAQGETVKVYNSPHIIRPIPPFVHFPDLSTFVEHELARLLTSSLSLLIKMNNINRSASFLSPHFACSYCISMNWPACLIVRHATGSEVHAKVGGAFGYCTLVQIYRPIAKKMLTLWTIHLIHIFPTRKLPFRSYLLPLTFQILLFCLTKFPAQRSSSFFGKSPFRSVSFCLN